MWGCDNAITPWTKRVYILYEDIKLCAICYIVNYWENLFKSSYIALHHNFPK